MIKAIACVLSGLLAIAGIGTGIAIKNASSDSATVSEQDMLKLSEGLDSTKKNDTFEIGDHPYDIFNYKAAGFSDLFTVNRTSSSQSSTSVTGGSRAQVTSAYNTKFGLSVGAKVPIQSVTIGTGTDFGMEIGNTLETINEEYFEYYETYKQTRSITTDWLSHSNLESYFSSSFVNDLSGVNDLLGAAALLTKYGTHVFDRYHLGGVLTITEYIASQSSIQSAYDSMNLDVSLSVKVADAAESNNEASDYSMNSNSVNNSTTKTTMNMKAWGGRDLNAITVQGLFTYNQEFATGNGSGYVYKEWLQSLDEDNAKEAVISADYPVTLWDLVAHSSYHNEGKEALLQRAYDVLCYTTYSDLCNQLAVDSKIIGSVSYKTTFGTDVSFNVTNGTIALPAGANATVAVGESVTKNFSETEAKLSLADKYDFVSLSGNTLSIADGAKGKTFTLLLNLYDDDVYHLLVEVKEESFSGGYGTEDQPYLIASNSDFNRLHGTTNYYTSPFFFKIVADLDFQGAALQIGGAGESFTGKIDGGGHTLSNFNIIPDTPTTNIGLFGSNAGAIENLKIKNARLINSHLLGSTHAGVYNAGLLVGDNRGLIQNVNIIDSAERLSFVHDGNGTSNVGFICGNNKGTVALSGVSDSFITGNVSGATAKVNVGGICGNLNGGNLSNVYVRGTSLKSSLYNGGSSSFSLGGLVGHVVFDEANSIKSKISMGVCYGNTFNQKFGNVGEVAGTSDSESGMDNVYYESNQECAVSSKAFAQCKRLSDVTLSSIANSEFSNNWTNDTGSKHNGKPILKAHLS
jgi:hypothetical protein